MLVLVQAKRGEARFNLSTAAPDLAGTWERGRCTVFPWSRTGQGPTKECVLYASQVSPERMGIWKNTISDR